MKKSTRKLLIAVALLLVAIFALAACDEVGGGKLSVKYDDSHVFTEGDDLETVKKYLTVTYTDADGTTSKIDDFELSGKLSKGESELTVTYNGVTTTVTVKVSEIPVGDVEIHFDEKCVIYEDDDLETVKHYLTVTYTNAEGVTTEITDYTLSGELTAGECELTVRYNGITATVTVHVASKSNEYIWAVFEGGDIAICEGDDLEKVRSCLSVTYTDAEGNTVQIENYALNGQIVGGECELTVTYNGLTTYVQILVAYKPMLLVENQGYYFHVDDEPEKVKEYLRVYYKEPDGKLRDIYDYDLIGTLTQGECELTVAYNGLTAKVIVDVVANNSLLAKQMDDAMAIYDTDDLFTIRNRLYVMYTDSNGNSDVVYDYMLDGDITFGKCELIVTYNDLSAKVTIDVKHRRSLSVELDEGFFFHENDKLDSIKPHLRVTYTDEDNVSTQITDFTLQGELKSGKCWISVIYDYTADQCVSSIVQVDVVSNNSLLVQVSKDAVIHPDEDLEVVKEWLTVIYTDSNGKSSVVTDYTLDGSLYLDNGYLTVTYNGITQSVSVTVSCNHVFSEKIEPATCAGHGMLLRWCTQCGYKEEQIIPQLPHTLTHHEAIAATCQAEGNVEYWYCSGCEKYFVDENGEKEVDGSSVILPQAHVFGAWVDEVPATCTNTGTVAHKDCSVCGCHFDAYGSEIENLEIAALGHKSSDWIVDWPATCTTQGCRRKECSVCYETLEMETIPFAHQFGNWIEEVPASCTEGTKGHYECSLCHGNFDANGERIHDLTIAAQHDIYVVGSKEPTCTECGWDSYEICLLCDYTTYVEIPALGHNLTHVEAKATNCEEEGNVEHWHCSTCQKNFSDANGENELMNVTIAVLGHDIVSHEAKSATCTEFGWEAYETCSRCDYTTYVEIPAFGHVLIYVEAQAASCTKVGNVEHWHCSNCKKNFSDANGKNELTNVAIAALGHDVVSHEAKVATCTEIGWEAYETCSRCDYTTYAEIPAFGHALTHVAAKSASCTEVGNVEHWHCSLCQKNFGDSKCENELQNVAIAALNHDIVHYETQAATCTEVGWEAYEACSRCDYTTYAEISALGHELSHVEAKTASCTEVGNVEYWHCSTCQKNFSDENGENQLESVLTPKDEHKYVEKICEVCGEKQPSDGLAYTLSSDGTYYSVSGIGTCTDTDVVIPSSYADLPVKEIASSAFSDCSSITSIDIPSSVSSIGSYAFHNCSNLTAVHITDIAAWCNIEFSYYYANPLYYAHNLYLNGELVTELEIPSAVTEIKNYVFEKSISLTSIAIPSGVTSIGKCAFYGCSNLTSIEIPSSVTSIGDGAFSVCSGLTAVRITDVAAWCKIVFYRNQDNPLYYAHNLYLNGELVTELEISSTVTEIKYGAFYECTSLTSVVIPASVKSIGNTAFYGCSNLTSVTFGKDSQLTSIGSGVFSDCSSLASIKIPACVTTIANNAFYNCGSLTSIEIPASVTSIGEDAFYDCSNLTSVTFGENSKLASIGGYAFDNCSGLTSIEIPASVTSIGKYAFRGCSSLTAVHITDLATWCNIKFSDERSNPLCQTPNLYLDGELVTELEIPSTVTEIKSYAFYYCDNLTSIVIPSSVASIGEYVFCGCSNLTSVTFGNNSQLISIGEKAFSSCSGLTSIDIPEGVASIGNNAFYSCVNLTSVTLGENSQLTSIGKYAFCYCRSLTSIEIPSGVTSIDTSAFGHCDSLIIYCGAESQPSGWNSEWNYSSCLVVWDCNNNDVADDGNIYIVIDGVRYALKDGVATVARQPRNVVSATIQSSVSYRGASYPVTSIGVDAFSLSCSSLISVVIPDSVTSIEDNAFDNCGSLTSIVIPSSVTSIGSYAFYKCSSLTIYCEVESEQSGWNSYWNYSNCPVVWDCNNNEVAYDGNVYTVIDGIRYALKDGVATVVRQPSNVVSVTIPSSVTYKENSYPVTSIGSFAFRDCTSLTSIEIPDSVTSISDAFLMCSSLTSVTFGENSQLESIGSSAFSGCSSLESITIPSSVTSIGSAAFAYCSSLISIEIPSSVTSIGTSVFSGCDSLKYNEYGNAYYLGNESNPYLVLVTSKGSITFLEVNDNTSVIADSAFYNCSSLTSISFGANSQLASISGSAFYNCSSLTSISFGTNSRLASISEGAFCNCSSLASIEIPSSVMSIGHRAFYNCSSLTSVTFGENSQLESIGQDAFSGCSSLTDIVIPSGVTSIGGYAFSGCSSLSEITIPFAGSKEEESRLSYIFNGATLPDSLTKVTITSVTYIGRYAFYGCSSLTSIILPSSVTSICDYAFYNCSSLTSIEIPSSVTSIGNDAFYNCSSLTSIEIPSSVTSIYYNVFVGCSGLESITVAEGNTVYHSEGNCLIETAIEKLIAGCKNSVIPADGSVGSIGYEAFCNCRSLTSIEIPDSVTSIRSSAFSGCSSLTSIVISSSVTWIESSAFSGCSSLTSIVMPDRVNIGSYVFANCSSLTSIIMPSSVISIDNGAFIGCSSLTSIEIPSSVTSIGAVAFSGCSSLTRIVIPDSVTRIGDSAFSDCSNLTIYCEAESQPSGWNAEWNSSNCPVVWGYVAEQ